jgi:hypothetical protein
LSASVSSQIPDFTVSVEAMLIAFCTSFRAKALSHNWAYHSWLLERVVVSMLAQKGVEVRVVIGGHDEPESAVLRDPRVKFLSLPVEKPQRNFDDMAVDKVLKLSAGVRWAQTQGCEYVVFNDADDLVSNRIGEHVAAHAGAVGWYNAAQYFYTYGGALTRLQRIADPASGPCAVVRTELLSFQAPPFHGRWADLVAGGGEQTYLDLLARHGVEVCTLAAAGLGHYRRLMAMEGRPLAPLPFAGNVVINHPDSMSTTGGVHGYRPISRYRFVRRAIGWIPTLRLATRALRHEFQVPATADIPPAYRGGGSIFWR